MLRRFTIKINIRHRKRSDKTAGVAKSIRKNLHPVTMTSSSDIFWVRRLLIFSPCFAINAVKLQVGFEVLCRIWSSSIPNKNVSLLYPLASCVYRPNLLLSCEWLFSPCCLLLLSNSLVAKDENKTPLGNTTYYHVASSPNISINQLNGL